MHTKGKDSIRERLSSYVSALKEGKYKKCFLKINTVIFQFKNCMVFIQRTELIIILFICRSEFSRGMILPQKNNVNKNVVNSSAISDIKAKMNATVVSSKKSLGYKIATATIKQQQKFQCRAEEFYNVFTTAEVFISSYFFYLLHPNG